MSGKVATNMATAIVEQFRSRECNAPQVSNDILEGLEELEANEAERESAPIDGLARFIISIRGNRISRVIGLRWRFFTDEHGWVPGEKEELASVISEIVEGYFTLAANATGRKRESYLEARKLVDRIASQIIARVDALIDKTTFKDWDSEPNLLGTPRGIWNLATHKLEPFSPGVRISLRTTGRPEMATKAARDRWDDFLKEVVPSEELREYLRWACGRAIFGSAKDDALYILLGPGGTGKSSFIGALSNAMGDYATSVDPSLLLEGKKGSGPKPELLQLLNRRMAFTVETAAGARLDEATIKALTGGDPITGRNLYDSPVKFNPSHSLFYATNAVPRSKVDTGLERRVRTLKFETRIQDGEVARSRREWLLESQEAADAVLAWLIDAAYEYRSASYREQPEEVKDASREMLILSDPFMKFLDEETEEAPSAWISTAELEAAFERWAEEHGHPGMSDRGFHEAMGGRGYKQERRRIGNGKRGRGWVGLRLSDEEDEDDVSTF